MVYCIMAQSFDLKCDRLPGIRVDFGMQEAARGNGWLDRERHGLNALDQFAPALDAAFVRMRCERGGERLRERIEITS